MGSEISLQYADRKCGWKSRHEKEKQNKKRWMPKHTLLQNDAMTKCVYDSAHEKCMASSLYWSRWTLYVHESAVFCLLFHGSLRTVCLLFYQLQLAIFLIATLIPQCLCRHIQLINNNNDYLGGFVGGFVDDGLSFPFRQTGSGQLKWEWILCVHSFSSLTKNVQAFSCRFLHFLSMHWIRYFLKRFDDLTWIIRTIVYLNNVNLFVFVVCITCMLCMGKSVCFLCHSARLDGFHVSYIYIQVILIDNQYLWV